MQEHFKGYDLKSFLQIDTVKAPGIGQIMAKATASRGDVAREASGNKMLQQIRK